MVGQRSFASRQHMRMKEDVTAIVAGCDQLVATVCAFVSVIIEGL